MVCAIRWPYYHSFQLNPTCSWEDMALPGGRYLPWTWTKLPATHLAPHCVPATIPVYSLHMILTPLDITARQQPVLDWRTGRYLLWLWTCELWAWTTHATPIPFADANGTALCACRLCAVRLRCADVMLPSQPACLPPIPHGTLITIYHRNTTTCSLGTGRVPSCQGRDLDGESGTLFGLPGTTD